MRNILPFLIRLFASQKSTFPPGEGFGDAISESFSYHTILSKNCQTVVAKTAAFEYCISSMFRKDGKYLKNRYKDLWKVFATFFKIGAFTFGGGYAMIPIIQMEAVEKNGWVTDDDILEIIAIAESTPGPIAINSATFVGYRTCGVLGSAVATLGVVMPSFIIIF